MHRQAVVVLGLLPLLVLAIALVARADTSAHEAGVPGISFAQDQLDGEFLEPTVVTFGPDGRLYVASIGGTAGRDGAAEIEALTLDPVTHDVLDRETIASGLSYVLGIAFEPGRSGADTVVYASHQDIAAPAGVQGMVSTFSAPGWTRTDVITGLPVDHDNLAHLTNALAFDPAGRLLIGEGATTDAGVCCANGRRPESPLSAALLVADVLDPAFDGTIAYDPPGPPANEAVNQAGGDVSVYAAGLRNSYDFVFHSNGILYATDNGPSFIKMYSSSTCTTQGPAPDPADELNIIVEGNYYGHPNRNRGRSDPRQCTYHPPQEPSGGGYTAPIAVLPDHCACSGVAEYTSDAFDGALQGDLLIAEFVLGDVARVVLSDDGASVESVSTLFSDLEQPLDLAVGPDGTIYVAEFDVDQVSFFVPASGPELPGDVNCDETRNAIDAALILQLGAGLLDALACPQNADVSSDGSVDAIDAALVLQYVAGLLSSL